MVFRDFLKVGYMKWMYKMHTQLSLFSISFYKILKSGNL